MVDDLITWLLARIKIDGERTGRILSLAETMYEAWQPSNPYSFAEQTDDVRDEYIRAATAAMDEQMPEVLAECEAKRRIIEHCHSRRRDWEEGRHDSFDRAEVLDDLAGVVKLLALPYADRPGYQESWRP